MTYHQITYLTDYKTVLNELNEYNKELLNKPRITILNKVDLINENTLNKKIKLLAQYEKTIYPISAINFKGINILLKNSLKKIVENKIEKEKTKNKWDPID